MKKLILPLVLLAFVVGACGTAQNTPAAGTDPAARTLPPLSKVAVGIFKLEGTDQAVTADQAATLLPLWEVYSTISASDTAASQEVEALAQQMQDGITADQMQAIDALSLTQQDVFALMQEKDLMAAVPQAGSGQSSGGGDRQFTQGFPAGGPPEGGQVFVGPGGGPLQRQGGTRPSTSGTPSPDGQTALRAGMNRIPAPLVQAVIDLLKERAGK